LVPVTIEEQAAAAAAPRPQARTIGRVSQSAAEAFVRELSSLLAGGVALSRALHILSREASQAAAKRRWTAIHDDVVGGMPLAEAMGRWPGSFSAVQVAMVRAGETGGFLEDVLHRLAVFIEKDQELRSRVAAALAYPALLIVIGSFAVIFLMVFFIPRFSEIFAKMGGNLPGPTRVVMAVSYFFRDYWMVSFGALVLMVLGWSQLSATVTGKHFVDRLKVRFPLFGDIVRKNSVSRFARTLGTLLKSGVPILGALSISKEAMGNVVLMEDIDEAAEGVKQGRGLADILRHSRYFPAMVIDMIAVGEEGGNLDEVLISVAESYDLQVDRAVRVFISLFEPALLLIMATLVGFIVISMLLPVFTLSSMVK